MPPYRDYRSHAVLGAYIERPGKDQASNPHVWLRCTWCMRWGKLADWFWDESPRGPMRVFRGDGRWQAGFVLMGREQPLCNSCVLRDRPPHGEYLMCILKTGILRLPFGATSCIASFLFAIYAEPILEGMDVILYPPPFGYTDWPFGYNWRKCDWCSRVGKTCDWYWNFRQRRWDPGFTRIHGVALVCEPCFQRDIPPHANWLYRQFKFERPWEVTFLPREVTFLIAQFAWELFAESVADNGRRDAYCEGISMRQHA